jgi:type I restriction enzyme R subunit
VDEAHRTQEGDLGRKMREALPNAFLFGLTGTPINRADRNTFYAFGADEDEKGYMSRYGFEESIRDGATLKLHFEPRLIDLHIDKAALDAAYKDLTGGLSDLDKDNLAKTAAKMAVLVKTPERIRKVCEDIVEHFQTKVEPNGFKGQIVTFDRESCLLFKAELDKLLPPEATDIVMSVQASDKKDHPEYATYDRTRDAEERLLDRFRDPADPLKLIIVTAKLLTGFDAPILQAMYLDKPLRDHTLLQAICRVNRTYSEQKTHGLIVDYLGIFDDVAAALEFDDQSVKQVVSNIQELKDKLPEAMQKCLAFFAGCDRSLQGYEGLIAAQQCLPNNEVRDNFAAEYSVLSKIWEALSPDTVLGPFEKDYKWLSQVYQSVQPSSGHGKLIWHSLGAKTIELIHQNVHVDAVRDDLDTLVLDADLLEAVLSNPDPKKAKEIEIKLKRRLRGHGGNPKFKKLSERLDALKDRFESGQINSVEFLKQLLEIAKETLQAEKEVPPEEDEDRGKAALTELFNEVKTAETPIMVERVVADIDEIVRLVRFPGWQGTQAGEREVKKALRKALFKYKLHADEELFEKSVSATSGSTTTQASIFAALNAFVSMKSAARLHLIAHQHREHPVRLDRVVDLHTQQPAHGRVHRGFPQLLGVHLAQPLVALAAHGAFGLLHQPGHRGAEVGDLLFLHLLAFAAAHDGIGAQQAQEGGAGAGQRGVVGAVQEVLADDAALDVAVVAAADAQQVLVGAGVEFGAHLGIHQS